MKHIKKFAVNESIQNRQEFINDINKLFKFHSYYLWGIEFEIDDDTIEDAMDAIESQMKFVAGNGKTAEENKESYRKSFEDLCNKYKNWKFENEEELSDSKHDHDWCEFKITIIDPNGNKYIGRGETCPAESPQIKTIIDNEEEKQKDYKEYLRLKEKWKFN